MRDNRTSVDATSASPGPPLPAAIYATLKAQILGGHYPPGTKLGEEELAAQFSISRTPLLAVLGRLAEDGLVRSYPRRGAYIAAYTTSDILEILDIREVLEGLASRLAAVNMDRATLMELKALFAVPEVRKMRKDPSVLASADQRFHAAIVGCTRNGRLRDLMAKLNDQMQMVRMRTITLPGRLDASIREHQDLVSALTAGDPRVAEERARRHIRNVRRAVLEHYRDPQSTEEKRL